MASDTASLEVTVGDLIDEMPIMYDDMTGTTHRWELDAGSGQARLVTERNVDEMMEENKFMYNEHDGHERWTNDVHNHVATIPDFLFYDLVKQFGWPKDNPKDWKRWLNDRDNRAFRTRPGKV